MSASPPAALPVCLDYISNDLFTEKHIRKSSQCLSALGAWALRLILTSDNLLDELSAQNTHHMELPKYTGMLLKSIAHFCHYSFFPQFVLLLIADNIKHSFPNEVRWVSAKMYVHHCIWVSVFGPLCWVVMTPNRVGDTFTYCFLL